jgi:cytochrome P450
LDDDIWESANEFRGFRFADLRSRSKEDVHRFQFTTITPKALHFGHGRQGCPGRFFASYELKAILSHIIETFDVKLFDEKAGRPANKIFGAAITPDESAQLLFRRTTAVPGLGTTHGN